MSGLITPATKELLDGVILPEGAYALADEVLRDEGIDPLEAFSETEHGFEIRRHHHAVAKQMIILSEQGEQ